MKFFHLNFNSPSSELEHAGFAFPHDLLALLKNTIKFFLAPSPRS